MFCQGVSSKLNGVSFDLCFRVLVNRIFRYGARAGHGILEGG